MARASTLAVSRDAGARPSLGEFARILGRYGLRTDPEGNLYVSRHQPVRIHRIRFRRRPSARGVRRIRRVGARPRCRPPHVLWPARAAASRPGIRWHRRGRRRHRHGAQGPRTGESRVLQRRHRGAARAAGRRPCALRHRRRQELGGLAAAPFHHQRGHRRARSQRHARQHRRSAPPAHRARRPVQLQLRLRGRRQAHRLLHQGDASPARGHPQDHGAHPRRLRHGAHQRERALRLPRPAWRAPARARPPDQRRGRCRRQRRGSRLCPAERRRLRRGPGGRRGARIHRWVGRGVRDLRARHHRRRVRARHPPRRDSAHLRRGPGVRAGCPRGREDRALHLRAGLLCAPASHCGR